MAAAHRPVGLLVLALCACLNAAPRALYLYLDESDSETVSLSWWDAAGEAAEIDIEISAGDGHYQWIRTEAASSARVEIRLPAEAPMATQLAFRARARPSGKESNLVSYYRAIPKPRLWAVPGTAGIDVTFTVPPGVDRVRLRRCVVRLDGAASEWVELTSAASATNRYLDADLAGWSDGAHYAYEAVSFKNAEQSDPATFRTENAPLSAPAIDSAQGQVGIGVDLLLRNTSAWGAHIRLARGDEGAATPTQIADLPARTPSGTVSFRDVAAGAARSYVYQAIAEGQGLQSPPSQRRVVMPLDAASGWKASLADAPPGDPIARNQAGAFAAVASQTSSQGVRSYSIVPAGYESDVLQTGAFAVRDIVFTANGDLHATYMRFPSGVPHVFHARHGAQGWEEEEIAARNTGNPALAVGPDGTVWVAWVTVEARTIELATRSGATWSIETVVSPQLGTVDSQAPLAIAVDEGGAPHMLVSRSPGMLHVWRDSSGWQVETTPVSGYSLRRAWLFAAAGQLWALTAWTDDGASSLTDFALRTTAGWTVVGRFNGAAVGAALSPDGQRAIAAFPGGGISIIGQASTSYFRWTKGAGTPFGAGFDPGGKAWVLDFINDHEGFTPLRPGNAVLYEEL